MSITYKQDGYDKEVYCNNAKTKLTIAKSCYGSYCVFFEDTQLREVYYLSDAKEVVEKLLAIGIGRDFANEK